MADVITKYYPIYINSKKVATAHEQTFDINPNKGNLFNAEGWAGLSIGASHTQISVQSIDPVGNTDVDVIALALSSGFIDVGLPLPDGTFKVQKMGVTNVQKKSASETGRSDYSFTLMGGPPKSI